MSRNVKDIKEVKIPDTYKLIKSEYLPDCNGLGIYLHHIKSGAKVCVISNDDNNKVFNIAFRTPPTDDTGVAHIIEHSVLCGSKKFTAKDPFVELAKGSVNTFLNAMTYPDKTCYPIASCNDKDYANLMDVYMDAVLHPNIYRHEEIFRQEGWHYEINDKDEPLTFNGVVYSEMKGAFSSPEDRFLRGTFNALFPDTAYGVESGGDPKAIPTLTYEQFLDFHRRYYHPTNSYIFFYGDLDIEDRLNWIDREYLSEYDVQPIDSSIAIQKPIGTVNSADSYPLAEEDSEEDAAYISWAYMLEKSDDLMTNAAAEILSEVLFNAPGAPIREALIKAGIGHDVGGGVESDVMQPFGILAIRNVDADKFDEMKKILKDELTKIVKEGLNRKSLLSAINKAEFAYCEADYGRTPKGLEYTLGALDTWLYDDDNPFAMLHRRDLFGKLRDNIETGYFENIVDKYMLSSDSNVFFVLKPERGLAQKNEEELAAELAKYKASLSPEQLDELIKANATLKAYQSEPSTPEDLLTIPQLTREDIDRDAVKPINEERSISGIPTVFHDIETNGIIYVDIIFDINRIKPEDVSYLGLASTFLGNMDTSKHSYLELNNEIGIHLGGIGMEVNPYCKYKDEGGYYVKIDLGGKALKHEIKTLVSLMMETVFDTDFTNGARVRELLNELKANFQYTFVASGHRAAFGIANAAIDSAARFSQKVSGREQYEYVCELLEKSDEELAKVGAHVREIINGLFTREGMIIGITGTQDLYDEFASAITDQLDVIPKNCGAVARPLEESKYAPEFDCGPTRSAFKIAGDVNYVAMVGRYKTDDDREIAATKILSSMLSMDYLWNNIRVLGGAYGCGFKYSSGNGMGGFYSYRDPNMGNTLDVYRKTVDFLKNFEVDDRQMTKFVLGTIGSMDTPMSPSAKGLYSMAYYMCGHTYEKANSIRHCVIDATPEDIRHMAEAIEKIVSYENYCVIGNEGAIDENKELFDIVKNGQ